jgi:hypothetical protein
VSTELIISLLAAVVSLAAVGVCVALAKTSPPASVNRTARRVTDLAEDTDARVTQVERRVFAGEKFLEEQMEQLTALNDKANKRLRGARRAEQASGNGEASGVDQDGLPPIGDPRRSAALEAKFR